MLLDDKTAIVHGAAGAIGSAVARAGAQVHLTGRTEATLNEVAQRIQRDGGTAHVAQLDVLDRPAVDRHAAAVYDSAGGIDVCFNATSNDDAKAHRWSTCYSTTSCGRSQSR
jgi:3-oxoacyl-[acyl-carrier protein] reductase